MKLNSLTIMSTTFLALTGFLSSCERIVSSESQLAEAPYEFPGIQSIKELDDLKFQLIWSQMPAEDVTYVVYSRLENQEYDFDKPAHLTKDTSWSTESLAFQGDTCFVVRYQKKGIIPDSNKNEMCTGHTSSSFSGITNLTAAGDGKYTLSWTLLSLGDVSYQVYMRTEKSTYDFSAPPVATVKENQWTSESLSFQGNTCFVVRYFKLRAPSDINTKELCTNSPAINFKGVKEATVESDGGLQLSWEKIDLEGIIYKIYETSSPGQYDFTKPPTHTTTDNSKKIPVFSLSFRKCFVVRYSKVSAPDDTNTNEICSELPVVDTFQGISTVASTDTGVVEIGWTQATQNGVQGYRIYQGNDFSNAVGSTNSNKNSFVVSNLLPDETYTFAVRAYDAYGREDSNTTLKTVTVINNAPPNFTGLASATQTSAKSVTLNWLAASGRPKEYRIYHAEGPYPSTPVVSYGTVLATVSAPATSITIDNLGDELAHSFVVRAASSGGQEDTNTVTKKVALPDNGPPVFTGIKNVSLGEGGALVSWDAAVGDTREYQVFYQEGTTLDFATATKAIVPGPAVSKLLVGLPDNRNWSFGVRAVDNRMAADTNSSFLTRYAGDLTPPTFAGYITVIALDENRIQVNFNRSAETDVSHYSIRIRLASDTSAPFVENTQVTQIPSGTVSGVITNLIPATEYEILVKAVDTSGNPSSNTSTLKRKTLDLTAPSFAGISGVTKKSTDASKTVPSWTAATDTGGVLEYRVYYSTQSMIGKTLVKTATYPLNDNGQVIFMTNPISGSATSTEINGLSEGTVYYFIVHAIDSSGNEDANTTELTYTVPFYSPPNPPTALVFNPNVVGPSANRQPSVDGTGELGFKVRVYVNSVLAAQHDLNSNQNFSIPITLPDVDGSYAVTASHVNPDDIEGNPGTVGTWQLLRDRPSAVISGGSPELTPNATSLNVYVSNADNVVSYRYSLVPNHTTSCGDASYLGSWTTAGPVGTGTPITAALGADGNYRLCIIAKDAAGNEQLTAEATSVDWLKHTAPPDPTTFTLANTITGSSTLSYTPKVTATIVPVAGADKYCVTTINSQPTMLSTCWSSSTTQDVLLTPSGGNITGYVWTRDVYYNVSTSSGSASMSYTEICDSGNLATSCTITTSKALTNGTVIGGQGNLIVDTGGLLSTQNEQAATLTVLGDLSLTGTGSIHGNFTLSANNLTVNSGGSIKSEGKGFQGVPSSDGGAGAQGGKVASGGGANGGGHGGAGGVGYSNSAGGGATNGSISAPVTYGGAGGAYVASRGCHGGGALKINITNLATINGKINSDGENGCHAYSGRGAGGSVWMTVGSFAGSGEITARGSTTPGSYGGGAGGGRISVTSSNAFRGSLLVDGSRSSTGVWGQPGTLYLNISNPCSTGTLATTCTISDTLIWGTSQALTVTGNLVIANGGKIKNAAIGQFISLAVTGSITVESGGVIESNLSNVTGTSFDIQAGGVVKADALGYVSYAYPSAETPSASSAPGGSSASAGGGGGHGGKGGNGGAYFGSASYAAGQTDGSLTNPTTFGGSGAGNYGLTSDSRSGGGGFGGGAIKISVPNLTVDGTLSANGEHGASYQTSGFSTGGGAGGSLWLNVTNLSGSGVISSNGGNGGLSSAGTTAFSGGGGGGRISIASTNKFSGTLTANGGTSGGLAQPGEPGIIYFTNDEQYCNTGTLASTCTMLQTWRLRDGVSLSVSGNLVLGSGASIFVAPTKSASISVSGNFVMQSNSSVTGNISITATNVTISSGANISANGSGFQGTNGPGQGPGAGASGSSTVGGSGGGHGGIGGMSGYTPGAALYAGGVKYGSLTAPVTWGSSGGGTHATQYPGGHGGGAVKIVGTTSVTLDGTISANGMTGFGGNTYCSAGGAGGSVWINTPALNGNGSISANGGDAISSTICGSLPGYLGGGGGGGRIAISSSNKFSVALSVAGGASTSSSGYQGETGTLSFSNSDNFCNSGTLATTCTISQPLSLENGQTLSATGSLVLGSGAKLIVPAEQSASINVSGDFTMQSGSTLKGNFTISATNVSVASGATIDASGLGHQGTTGAGTGTGGGTATTSTIGASGGGHGGRGGNSGAYVGTTDYRGGQTYGSLTSPVTFGSSGGGGTVYRLGGAGGGALKISGTTSVTINGTVNVDGKSGAATSNTYCAGGGAGGSIWIDTPSLLGNGSLSARGGNASTVPECGGIESYLGGGGGGGRIALNNSNKFAGSVNVNGGAPTDVAGYYGEVGEVSFANEDQYCTSGTRATTCTISQHWRLRNNQIFEVSGNLVLANGGRIYTVAGESASIQVVGDTTLQSGSAIIANLTSLTSANLDIQTGAFVSVDGLGFQGSFGGNGDGTGGGKYGTSSLGAGGGGHGGDGGRGSYPGSPVVYAGGTSYGSSTSPATFGSAGGGNSQGNYAGGNGGGAVKFQISGTFTLNGSISANGKVGFGNNSGVCSGGGAGGSIFIDTPTLSGNGSITANGGPGKECTLAAYQAGGGSGGRIRITNSNKFSGSLTANGGLAGGVSTDRAQPGEMGTIVFSNDEHYCASGSLSTTCTISNSWRLIDSQVLSASGDLIIASTGVIYTSPMKAATINVTGDMTIQSGGKIDGNLNNLTANNLTVASGAFINANRKGNLGTNYAGAGSGGGARGYTTLASAGGGGFGGAGGNGADGVTYAGGPTYGSATNPADFGSAGGGNSYAHYQIGGDGGGKIRITVTGTTTINGTVSANGGDGMYFYNEAGSGGGSGGSIWLQTGTLAGSGSITSTGGAGVAASAYAYRNGGGGGGGRISLIRSSSTFSGTTSVAGGTKVGTGTNNSGSAGTLNIE